MSHHNHTDYSKILAAFIGGAAAGAIAGLLLAPRSGEAMRGQLVDYGQELKHRGELLPEAVKNSSVAARDAFVESMTEGDRNGRASRSKS